MRNGINEMQIKVIFFLHGYLSNKGITFVSKLDKGAQKFDKGALKLNREALKFDKGALNTADEVLDTSTNIDILFCLMLQKTILSFF